MHSVSAFLIEPLLQPARPKPRTRLTVVIGVIVTVLLLALAFGGRATFELSTSTLTKEPSKDYLYGTSFGGWLVMEINPSVRLSTSSSDVRPQWMFDQLSAASELDFVTTLRAEKSDEYAIRTMRNHWEHYISDDMLDAAVALGVNAVRIPVGFWIMDAPGSSDSPLDFGFSPEGFVTGGLNYLHAMVPGRPSKL